MKSALSILLLATTAAPASNEFINFVRQTQRASGVVWDMPVDPAGSSPSVFPLEESGALFELWTVHRETGKSHLLDWKTVGAYLPHAQLKVTTGDPCTRVARTRADQPFAVAITIGGLLPGGDVPEAARRVVFERHLAVRPTDGGAIDPLAAVSGKAAAAAYIEENGTRTLDFPATALPAADPTKAGGEEHFVVKALADGDAAECRLAGAIVEIWPVASGRITGIANGDRVRFSPPPLQIVLEDLYPASETYVRILPAGGDPATASKRLDGSVLVLDQDRAESRTLTVTDYGAAFPADGRYAMELVTITPFGAERLDHVIFDVDRELNIRGHLVDLDRGR